MKRRSQLLKTISNFASITLAALLLNLAVLESVVAVQPQVAAGITHTVGLKSDGTVIAVGGNSHGHCEVGSWTDIMQVSAGGCTLGLKSDGGVLSVGMGCYGPVNFSDSWSDIIQVEAGSHNAGLKSDGTVVVEGCGS